MRRVGLTGGIGSGKSEVARIFESLGAYVIDTDRLAREAVAPGSDGLREIGRAWPAVVAGDRLDRARLAEIVFHDPAQRERLNAIVHPHVRRLAGQLERHAAPEQLIVHVVPLLFETGYARNMEASIVVVAPEDARIERVAQRDRLSQEQIRARMQSQIDPREAKKLADYCIENDGNLAHLKKRVTALYRELLQNV